MIKHRSKNYQTNKKKKKKKKKSCKRSKKHTVLSLSLRTPPKTKWPLRSSTKIFNLIQVSDTRFDDPRKSRKRRYFVLSKLHPPQTSTACTLSLTRSRDYIPIQYTYLSYTYPAETEKPKSPRGLASLIHVYVRIEFPGGGGDGSMKLTEPRTARTKTLSRRAIYIYISMWSCPFFFGAVSFAIRGRRLWALRDGFSRTERVY